MVRPELSGFLIAVRLAGLETAFCGSGLSFGVSGLASRTFLEFQTPEFFTRLEVQAGHTETAPAFLSICLSSSLSVHICVQMYIYIQIPVLPGMVRQKGNPKPKTMKSPNLRSQQASNTP